METEAKSSATKKASSAPAGRDRLDPFAGFTYAPKARKLLQIRPSSTEVDELARAARGSVKEEFEGKADEVEDVIDRSGLSTTVEHVTKRLRRTALSEQERFLLSDEDIYAAMLLEAFGELSTTAPTDDGEYGSSGTDDKPTEEAGA